MNRLPPEVIALCASFVSHADPRPTISLTHVCRYWRRAIISSPRNWASIGSGWKRLAPLCLDRAGVVPLTVNITISDIKADAVFLEASLALSRTRTVAHLSLTGCASVEAVANAAPTLFASTVHGLVSLELQQTAEPIELFPPDTPPAPPISWKLSELKSLRLTRTPLYPALTSATSLVELELVGYTTPFQFGKVIGLLRSNPDLESVVLDIQFVEVPLHLFPSARPVSLVRLRQLSFTCADPIDSRWLISSLSLPHGACLEITASGANPCTKLHYFLPSPPTPFQEVLAPITVIKYRDHPRVIQLYGNGSCFSFRCSRIESNVYGELFLFTTTSVREFHVEISSCYDLSRTLRRFPGLESLALVNITHFRSQALGFLAEEPTLCPSLKTIAFFDCDLDRRVIEDLEWMVAKRKKSTAAWLHRVVIVRKTGSLPDYKLIHRLRESVPCVEARIDNTLPDLS